MSSYLLLPNLFLIIGGPTLVLLLPLFLGIFTPKRAITVLTQFSNISSYGVSFIFYENTTHFLNTRERIIRLLRLLK